LIASLVFTTNAFSADAHKSAHPKHHAKGAHSQAQHHVSVPKASQPSHKSAANKKKNHHAQHVRHV